MNKFLGIGFVIILLVGIASGLLLVQRQQQLKSKASGIMDPAPVGLFPCARPNQPAVGEVVGRCPSKDANGCYLTARAHYTDNTLDINGDGVADPANPGDQPQCDASDCGEPKQCEAGSGGGTSTQPCLTFAAPRAQYCSGKIPLFDTCTAKCVNGKRYYDCKASQDPNRCAGTDIGCDIEDSQCASSGGGTAADCKSDCTKCTPATTCGNKTYQNCDTSTCKKAGDKFKCQASENANCSYSEYPCDATCIAANSGGGGGGGGGSTGGTGGSGPSAGAPKGSECVSYQIIDSTTKDVTGGPVYENEKYVFKLTFKNKATAGEPQPWTKATHKLQAIGNTSAAWAAQATYPLTKDTVTKDNIEVFNIDATALPLPEGKNFEERPFHYSMADQGGPFGAICERNITVLKKPAGLSTTKCYVVSEDASEIDNVTSCDDPKARTYTAHPTNLSYPFKTPLVAGTPRTIYVKFFDSSGKSSGTPFTKTIVYTPPASISGVDCAYDTSGLATTYTIRGTSLGAQTVNTRVKVGNADAVVSSWTASTIAAKVDQRLEGNSSVQVSLDDGKKLDGTCSVGTTTATLSVKNKCATSETLDTADVEVSIYESGPQPFIKQKIRPDKDGALAGFAPKLEKNKNYTALFKKPGFLTKKAGFNTTSGTAVAEAAVLIPGDIAPKPTADNVINSFDFSELKTQWDLVKDVTRTGDLNKDSRVNSFDWSCMKSSSNQQGDIFVAGSAGVGSTSPAGVGATSP